MLAFRWHPAGNKIAYVALPPAGPREKELLKKGFGFIFFEEDWKPRNLYLTDVRKGTPPGPAEQLSQGLTVWDFEFSPDGRAIAAACSPHNLVDDEYMFKKIYLMDLQSKTCTLLIDPQSKLGNLAFSPDGTKLAYAAARARNDHAVSQAYVLELKKAQTRNLTPADFAGHATWVGWADNQSLLFLAAEGVWNTLNRLPLRNPKREILLDSRKTGTIFGAPEQAADSRQTSLIANSPDSPGDLFSWTPPAPPHRLTTLNPWIAERRLGKQEVFRYRARDGQELEGILVYPLAAAAGRTYPLIVSVHGGPESNQSNGWLTGTNHPAQVLAGKGYLAFYPNYRASTGYGVAFAMAGYEDPAGKEFDDIADGIDALVQRGLADRERVGLGGGSYGGYAAAWFASYYTRYVRAVVMFVGISDLISKRGTTDIPYEELYVHSGKKLEEMWDLALKRSPIYWAKQSRSAVLIMGGTSDTRVDPGQSKEFYRQLKMNNHPAVRLVQYPGEGHGNRKQPGRIDMLYRHLQWYDWYVRDRQPLDGPLPPLDISDCYGIKLPN